MPDGVDGSIDHLGAVVNDMQLHALRQLAAHLVHFGKDLWTDFVSILPDEHHNCAQNGFLPISGGRTCPVTEAKLDRRQICDSQRLDPGSKLDGNATDLVQS